MTLAELTLTAILSVVRPPVVDVATERPRLEQMAAAIADAVEQRDHIDDWLHSVSPLPFRGESREATALALVAIAFHESGFSARVSDCRRIGAFERSLTAFQLHGPFARGPYSEAEVCSSPRLAAERALYVFSLHGSRCVTPIQWFRGYASGSCGKRSGAASRQCAIWERLARAADARWAQRRARSHGVPPSAIARCIVKACADRRPRVHYFAPLHAKGMNLAKRWLPDAWFQRALGRLFSV